MTNEQAAAILRAQALLADAQLYDDKKSVLALWRLVDEWEEK